MEQTDLLRHAADTLDLLGVSYLVVGSFASMAYGEMRTTQDIDIAGILRITDDGVDRAEVQRWAKELGYLDAWCQVVGKMDAPDSPPGPGVP